MNNPKVEKDINLRNSIVKINLKKMGVEIVQEKREAFLKELEERKNHHHRFFKEYPKK